MAWAWQCLLALDVLQTRMLAVAYSKTLTSMAWAQVTTFRNLIPMVLPLWPASSQVYVASIGVNSSALLVVVAVLRIAHSIGEGFETIGAHSLALLAFVAVLPTASNIEERFEQHWRRFRVVADPGAWSSPQSFGQFLSNLIGRLSRVCFMGLDERWHCYCDLEDFLVMVIMSYPLPFARRLVSSLPASPAALLLRCLVRRWMAPPAMRPSGSGGASPFRPPAVGPTAAAALAPRVRSVESVGPAWLSSSSSSGERRKKCKDRWLSKAKPLLEREDSGCRSFVGDKKQSKTWADMEQLAQIFKDALAGTFASFLPPSPAPSPSASPLPPSSSPSAAVPASSPAPSHPESSVMLSSANARPFESEFGHVFRLTDLVIPAITKKLVEYLKVVKHSKNADRVIKFYDAVPPRNLKLTAAKVFQFFSASMMCSLGHSLWCGRLGIPCHQHCALWVCLGVFISFFGRRFVCMLVEG